MLARRVCEGRAGLLTLVEGLLVADTHTRLAELGLSELRLGLEARWLWLHGGELLLHLRHLGHLVWGIARAAWSVLWRR